MGLPFSRIFPGFWALIFLQAIAFASPPVTSGIHLSSEAKYQLAESHKKQLVSSLRRITGLDSLGFTEEGLLTLGERPEEYSGSKLAREILQWALDKKHVFIIEDHSGSPSVHFGQLDQGLIYEDARNGLRLIIWRVRIDFKDFQEMEAPTEVRSTFDPGFTLLHELLHGLGYKDARRVDEIGECETVVNQARAELRLPLRDQYFGESFQLAQNAMIVRLRFRSKRSTQQISTESPGRVRMQYLIFALPMGYELITADRDDLHLESLMKARR